MAHIQHLNTDLDLICDRDPTPLAAEFESRGLIAIVTPCSEGNWYLRCEDENDTEPEPHICRKLDVIESLPDDARRLWERSTQREFDAGFECGDEPRAFNVAISNDCLRRMAACGASFRITLYPANSSESIAFVGVDRLKNGAWASLAVFRIQSPANPSESIA